MTFNRGDRVRTINANTDGHTRIPAYLRAREGTVVRAVGAFPFPDERVRGNRDAAEETLYTVQFAGSTVWGEPGAGVTICADLFEPYLEKIP